MLTPLSFLIKKVTEQFRLPLDGIHGVSHWYRVAVNGNVIASRTPTVDKMVVSVFAFVHDSQRAVDEYNVEHGVLAAGWALSNRNTLFDFMSDAQFNLMIMACSGHTTEIFSNDLTIQACWDADRLDIGRCKEFIDPEFLGTRVAKDEKVMAAALARSREEQSFNLKLSDLL